MGKYIINYKLGGINLLIGNNNSGKTSVLEAIQILATPFDPSAYVRVGRVRNYYKGESTLDSLLWLFPGVKSEANFLLERDHINISASINNKRTQLFIECLEKKFIKSDFVSEPTVLYGNDTSEQMELFENTLEYEVRSLEFFVTLTKDVKTNTKTFEIKEGIPLVPMEQTLSIYNPGRSSGPAQSRIN
jgi:AAA15 family ATPase/GTPase